MQEIGKHMPNYEGFCDFIRHRISLCGNHFYVHRIMLFQIGEATLGVYL